MPGIGSLSSFGVILRPLAEPGRADPTLNRLLWLAELAIIYIVCLPAAITKKGLV